MRRPSNSAGTSEAAANVGTTVIGASPSAVSTRRIFSSVLALRPYPDLASMVVVPYSTHCRSTCAASAVSRREVVSRTRGTLAMIRLAGFVRTGSGAHRPEAATPRYQVGVAVHEARHHHSPRGREFGCLPDTGQIFDPAGWSYIPDHAILDENRAVIDDLKLAKSRAATRARGASQCDQLPGAMNEQHAHCVKRMSCTSRSESLIIPRKQAGFTLVC